jgi:hypothetical protein
MAHKIAGQEPSRFLTYFFRHTFATLYSAWRGVPYRGLQRLLRAIVDGVPRAQAQHPRNRLDGATQNERAGDE